MSSPGYKVLIPIWQRRHKYFQAKRKAYSRLLHKHRFSFLRTTLRPSPWPLVARVTLGYYGRWRVLSVWYHGNVALGIPPEESGTTGQVPQVSVPSTGMCWICTKDDKINVSDSNCSNSCRMEWLNTFYSALEFPFWPSHPKTSKNVWGIHIDLIDGKARQSWLLFSCLTKTQFLYKCWHTVFSMDHPSL